jgi:hypothetical protein
MFCVFHPTNAATAHCASCNRPLCAACDHRIKAQPFCEDCIVRGVDVLRRPIAPIVAPQPAAYPPYVPHHTPGAGLATLFALVPGLGAVYNRQNLKALVHFVGSVGLMELGASTGLGVFGFGGFVFFLYTVIDANRSAKAIAAGMDPADDERRLKWMFARYKPIWGMMLIAAAVLAAITSIGGLPFNLSPARVWAVVLFLAGVYMIFAYFRSLRREDEPRSFASPPRSVVSSTLPSDVAGLTTTYSEGRSSSHLGDR